MIILLSGATHCGKTHFALQLIKKYGCMCLSIDHLKMGLIRSGICPLSPEDSDEVLTNYLWPVVREMIKTAIENRQDLIVEGCYIPFDYKKYFDDAYLCHIKYLCLVFSGNYINTHFDEIKSHGSDAELRLDDGYCTKELLLRDNRRYLEMCHRYNIDYKLIDTEYPQTLDLQ